MEAWNSPEFEGTKEERAVAMYREAITVEEQPENQAAIDVDNSLCRMFEQRPMTALEAYSSASGAGSVNSIFTTAATVRISEWNVLRAVVLTAWAMLSRAKVRGRFITSKGTGAQKNRAEQATRWLDGWSRESKVHRVMGMALRDAEVCRFGVVQVYTDGGKVKPQRCLPHEITFDFVGSILGEPRVIHRKRPMSKATLLKKYGKGNPKARDAIKAAKTIDLGTDNVSDMVLVREAYSLPSTEDAKDGWHAIAIEGPDGCLCIEEWKYNWWPFIFVYWDEAFIGLNGISLAAQLETMQTELNYMAWVERQAFKLMVVPRVGVKRGSKVTKTPMTNGIGSVIEYTDQPPVPLVWGALPPEFYVERDKRVQKMYELAGVAQNVSQGEKAPGADSGVAQREALDTQGLRLQSYAQRSWEDPHVELFEKAVYLAQDLVKTGNSYKVKSVGSKESEMVDFKGTVTDLEDFAVAVYPTGFLPLTPSARLDFILQMLNSKLWDVDRCRQALSDLDVDSEQTMENQIIRMATNTFERMLYEGKPVQPNELDVANYSLMVKTASLYFALARNNKEPDDNVSLMSRFMDELQALKEGSTPAPQPQPPVAVPPGQAPPPPPPGAELPGQAPVV